MRDNEWYEDDHISLLLEHKFLKNKNVKILEPMIANDWRVDDGDKSTKKAEKNDTLTPNLKEFHDRRPFEIGDTTKNKVIVPLNLGDEEGVGHHWVFVGLTYEEESEANKGKTPLLSRVDYFDPMGAKCPNVIKKKLNAVFGPGHIHSYKDKLQTDGFNCGPWIVEFAEMWVNEGKVPEEVKTAPKKFITDKRKEHQKILESKQSKIVLELPEEKKKGYFKRRNSINNVFKDVGEIKFVGEQAEKAIVTIKGERNHKIEISQENGKDVLSTFSSDPQIFTIMVRKALEMIKDSGKDPLKHKISIEAPEKEVKERLEKILEDERERYQKHLESAKTSPKI